jgi:hypothetical protein
MVSFWQPHLLYLKRAPHAALYVEIDAVEGTGPSDSEIDRLRGFLERYCDKPDGVHIVVDSHIPASAVEGKSEESLALKYLDGPPVVPTTAQPAFLYIFYYDSGFCNGADYRAAWEDARSGGTIPWDISAELWRGGTNPWEGYEHPRAATPVRKPHITLLPYPGAVFIDRRYGPWGHAMWDLFLLHEIGHVLGLARDLDHGDGMHCNDMQCLMNEKARVEFLGWLSGEERPHYQHDLCDRCRCELDHYRNLPADPGLSFAGPLLVRSEGDYHVLSLPGFVELYIGSLAQLDPRAVLKDAHRHSAHLRHGGLWVNLRVGLIGEHNRDALTAALKHARHDPYAPVRRIAEREARSGVLND